MACPFNSLYWDFFARHRKRLKQNARVGMMYRVWDRMDNGEKKQVLHQAAAYLKKSEPSLRLILHMKLRQIGTFSW